MRPSILRRKLRAILKGAARIAVMGVGSELRSDDAAGLLALERLRESHGKKQVPSSSSMACARKVSLKLFNGGTAPENLTGAIRRFSPACLVIIDAVDLGIKAGAFGLVDISRAAHVFLTHKLPLKLMLDFMNSEMKFKTVFIGIQPGCLEFGETVSAEVASAARRVGNMLRSVISASGRGRSCRAGRRKPSRLRRQAARAV